MKINFGYLLSKAFKYLYRPALRNCRVDKTAFVGSATNCIDTKIGRYTYLGNYNSIINAEIGSFCSIASYCAIGGSGHSMDAVSTSPVFYKGKNVFKKNFSDIEILPPKKVAIGNDVWIGEGVFIFEGVTVGNGAVIGAHSVVKDDVAPYSVVAGAPAKHIKFRFDGETVSELEKSEWWNMTDEELAKKDGFDDPKKFLNHK